MNVNALKDRIRTIAKERGQTAKECWIKLYLERFLARLSRSAYSDIGRETSDLDFGTL